MSSELLVSLAEFINTTEDLRVLETEVAAIKDGVYATGHQGLATVLKERVRAQVARIIEPTLASKPDQVLSELQTELKQLPILRMNIAFQPTQSTIEKISSWLKTNTNQGWVLDLVINPEVGAGAIIEVNGYFRDYSLKEKMNQVVQQATQHLLTKITS